MSDIDILREELELLGSMIDAERATPTPENRQCTDEQIERCHKLRDRLQSQQPKTLSDDEIDQIVIVNHERIENEDFDSYESFAEAVTFEHGRRFGIKEGLEIARENGYLSQSNAEPVAWAYFGDFPDGKRLISADNTNLWGSDGIPLYTHPPASTEHPSYVYSRDYEALYDLLMRGGEALGRQWNHPGTRIVIPTDIRPLHVPQWQHMMMLDKARFAKVCSEMNLEWIAPSTEPRLTVEQAMEACAAANVEWSLGGYKGTKKREWADEYKRMLRDRLIKAARP